MCFVGRLIVLDTVSLHRTQDLLRGNIMKRFES